MNSIRRCLYFILGLSLGACLVTTAANAMTVVYRQTSGTLDGFYDISGIPTTSNRLTVCPPPYSYSEFTYDFPEGTTSISVPVTWPAGTYTRCFRMWNYSISGYSPVTATVYDTFTVSPPLSIPITAAEAVPVIDSVKYGLTGLLTACIFAVAWRG